MAPAAELFENDPVVEAFREYTVQLSRTLGDPAGDPEDLLSLTTGSARPELQREIEKYRAGSWHLFGTAEVVVVDLVKIDDVRWSVDSCEYDLAAYPVDESGNAAVLTEDRWIPEAHYFMIVDGEWKLDSRYRGNHECGRLK